MLHRPSLREPDLLLDMPPRVIARVTRVRCLPLQRVDLVYERREIRRELLRLVHLRPPGREASLSLRAIRRNLLARELLGPSDHPTQLRRDLVQERLVADLALLAEL